MKSITAGRSRPPSRAASWSVWWRCGAQSRVSSDVEVKSRSETSWTWSGCCKLLLTLKSVFPRPDISEPPHVWTGWSVHLIVWESRLAWGPWCLCTRLAAVRPPVLSCPRLQLRPCSRPARLWQGWTGTSSGRWTHLCRVGLLVLSAPSSLHTWAPGLVASPRAAGCALSACGAQGTAGSGPGCRRTWCGYKRAGLSALQTWSPGTHRGKSAHSFPGGLHHEKKLTPSRASVFLRTA